MADNNVPDDARPDEPDTSAPAENGAPPDPQPPDPQPPDPQPSDGEEDDPTGLQARSLDELEHRLTALAGRIAAAECEFLVTLAEFDARGGWGVSGVKSAAHWLSWRTGLRLGVAREKVRVARALTRLPLIRDAFSKGTLSYCKVRALSRVATPSTEPTLLELARGATGAQLEQIVKAWRRTLLGESGLSRHLRRGLRRREEPNGSVVFTIRLAPEDAAVVDAALAAGRRIVRDPDGKPIETPEEERLAEEITGEPPATRADADVVVLLAESFLTSGTVPTPGSTGLVMVHTDLVRHHCPTPSSGSRRRGVANAST